MNCGNEMKMNKNDRHMNCSSYMIYFIYHSHSFLSREHMNPQLIDLLPTSVAS